MRKAFLTVVFVLCFTVLSFAQSTSIYGTIKSSSGEEIPFATLYIKGLQKGESADENGIFKMDFFMIRIKTVSYRYCLDCS